MPGSSNSHAGTPACRCSPRLSWQPVSAREVTRALRQHRNVSDATVISKPAARLREPAHVGNHMKTVNPVSDPQCRGEYSTLGASVPEIHRPKHRCRVCERASLHAWCSQLLQSRFAARQWSYACTSSWISAVSISCRDPSRLWQITTCATHGCGTQRQHRWLITFEPKQIAQDSTPSAYTTSDCGNSDEARSSYQGMTARWPSQPQRRCHDGVVCGQGAPHQAA